MGSKEFGPRDKVGFHAHRCKGSCDAGCVERNGAQGQRIRKKAADLSTAAAQDQLREVLWENLMVYLKEQCHEQSILAELERLRVA
jgi:hypothetical protein